MRSKTSKNCMIIGQGIGGTMLAWHALQGGWRIDVYDEGALKSTSHHSSAIINPVTGPNFVKSWRTSELVPFARKCYQEIQTRLQGDILIEMPLWRHVHDIRAENLWRSKMMDAEYEDLISIHDNGFLLDQFRNANLFGRVDASFRINASELISSFRTLLKNEESLKEETVRLENLELGNGFVHYQGRKYDHCIVATGYHGVVDPWFVTDAYRPAKGEILLCRLNSFPRELMVKFGKFIVHLEDDLFWVGSNFQYDFNNEYPDKDQLSELNEFLEHSVVSPYEVEGHFSGIRPATKYRRPLIGTHPGYGNLHLFNGLGTKGFSLAPFFSARLIDSIKRGQVFETEAFRKAFQIL